LPGARLEAVLIGALTQRSTDPAGASPGLVPEHGWRYRGTGTIVSTQPPCADLGPLRLALTGDGGDFRVGEVVSVAIDRIVLTRD
jgi:hypothetical protein